MGEHTAISWTHHTFSPWWGCAEISPACDHCYARAWAKRVGFPDLWGANANRRFFSDAHWRNPLKWDRKAREAGERRRVFCASMADVFDNHPDVATERLRLWDLIRSTPHLDWLLLTKRIGNTKTMLPADWGDGYANAWLGATIANQEEADRDIPKLLATPARVRFLSCEPLLAPVNLQRIEVARGPALPGTIFAGGGKVSEFAVVINALRGSEQLKYRPLDWVIAGSESGRGARPCDLSWVRSLRDQCRAWNVAFHWKQHVVAGIKTHTPELDGQRWVEFPRATQ